MRYVVLLRGVNVGGHKKVSKADFKLVLESLGYRDVVIYINSGNSVFTSKDKVFEETIQNALERHFGFSIPTLLLTGDTVINIANSIPKHWTNDSPSKEDSRKSDVLYLFKSIDSPTIIEKIGHNKAIEEMIYVEGAVLYSISRKHQTRSALLNLVGTKLYKEMTIRNVNTARKLEELVKNL